MKETNIIQNDNRSNGNNNNNELYNSSISISNNTDIEEEELYEEYEKHEQQQLRDYNKCFDNFISLLPEKTVFWHFNFPYLLLIFIIAIIDLQYKDAITNLSILKNKGIDKYNKTTFDDGIVKENTKKIRNEDYEFDYDEDIDFLSYVKVDSSRNINKEINTNININKNDNKNNELHLKQNIFYNYDYTKEEEAENNNSKNNNKDIENGPSLSQTEAKTTNSNSNSIANSTNNRYPNNITKTEHSLIKKNLPYIHEYELILNFSMIYFLGQIVGIIVSYYQIKTTNRPFQVKLTLLLAWGILLLTDYINFYSVNYYFAQILNLVLFACSGSLKILSITFLIENNSKTKVKFIVYLSLVVYFTTIFLFKDCVDSEVVDEFLLLFVVVVVLKNKTETLEYYFLFDFNIASIRKIEKEYGVEFDLCEEDLEKCYFVTYKIMNKECYYSESEVISNEVKNKDTANLSENDKYNRNNNSSEGIEMSIIIKKTNKENNVDDKENKNEDNKKTINSFFHSSDTSHPLNNNNDTNKDTNNNNTEQKPLLVNSHSHNCKLTRTKIEITKNQSKSHNRKKVTQKIDKNTNKFFCVSKSSLFDNEFTEIDTTVDLKNRALILIKQIFYLSLSYSLLQFSKQKYNYSFYSSYSKYYNEDSFYNKPEFDGSFSDSYKLAYTENDYTSDYKYKNKHDSSDIKDDKDKNGDYGDVYSIIEQVFIVILLCYLAWFYFKKSKKNKNEHESNDYIGNREGEINNNRSANSISGKVISVIKEFIDKVVGIFDSNSNANTKTHTNNSNTNNNTNKSSLKKQEKIDLFSLTANLIAIISIIVIVVIQSIYFTNIKESNSSSINSNDNNDKDYFFIDLFNCYLLKLTKLMIFIVNINSVINSLSSFPVYLRFSFLSMIMLIFNSLKFTTLIVISYFIDSMVSISSNLHSYVELGVYLLVLLCLMMNIGLVYKGRKSFQ